MSRLGTRDAAFINAMFNHVPACVVAVDREMRVLEYNAPASSLFGASRRHVVRRRAGSVFRCVHAREAPRGCGTSPHCGACGVRGAAMEAFAGEPPRRRRATLEIVREGRRQQCSLMVGATRFVYRGAPMALLVLDDVRALPAQQRLISICMSCKKVRNQKDLWVHLETFFRDRLNADFSHGYCPECVRAERKKLAFLRRLERE
jgi:hypothetical protein